MVQKGYIMKIAKPLFISVLITLFIYAAFNVTGVGAAFAAEGGPTSAHETASEYGTLFYIGLGAVAVIATFAIWQNVKDSENKEIETEVLEAEEREVEDFEEYFETLEKTDE
jgi:hypothetical protein